MFRKTDFNSNSGPVYCCQSDGMIGLGCGARSYTENYHYSGEYAVSDAEIRQILTAFIQSPDSDFNFIHYGLKLDAEDRRRRYVLLSLLSEAGVNLKDYTQRFNTDIFEDLSELSELLDLNLAIVDNQRLCLTEAGIERSDTIGYWLFSDRVRALIKEYQLK
jgi:oxygen-independent coproporphyrinogen-3 oxidase